MKVLSTTVVVAFLLILLMSINIFAEDQEPKLNEQPSKPNEQSSGEQSSKPSGPTNFFKSISDSLNNLNNSIRDSLPKQKPVTDMDVYGMKLGMSESEIRTLFPEEKILTRNLGLKTHLEKTIRINIKEEKSHANIQVDFVNEKWGQGAVSIKYEVFFESSIPPDYYSIRKKIIDKYGAGVSDAPEMHNIGRGRWRVRYGDRSGIERISNRRISYTCGRGLQVELNRSVLRFHLYNTCPELKYKRASTVKADDVKF